MPADERGPLKRTLCIVPSALLTGLMVTGAHALTVPSVPAATCTNNHVQAGNCTFSPTVSILSTSDVPVSKVYNYVTLYYYLQIPSALALTVPVHVQAFLEASQHLAGFAAPPVDGPYPIGGEYAVFNVNTKVFVNGQTSMLYAGIGAGGFRGIGPANQIGHDNQAQTVTTFSAGGTDFLQSTSLRVDTHMNLKTNTTYTVTLFASSMYGLDIAGASRSGKAFVDPYFEIDPAFLSANPQMSPMIFSQGIANVPVAPVPEPSQWMLLAAGVAGLALRLGQIQPPADRRTRGLALPQH